MDFGLERNMGNYCSNYGTPSWNESRNAGEGPVYAIEAQSIRHAQGLVWFLGLYSLPEGCNCALGCIFTWNSTSLVIYSLGIR